MVLVKTIDEYVDVLVPIGKKVSGAKFFEIDEALYDTFRRIRGSRFLAKEKNWFGVEEKIILVSDHESLSPVSANSADVHGIALGTGIILHDMLGSDFDKYGIMSQVDSNGSHCIELTRGVFGTPAEEAEITADIRVALDKVATGCGFKPYYGGMEGFTGKRSYGHHVHWSAGGVLDTMLLHTEVANDLWRIIAFSANSPLITEEGKVMAMNDRFAKTYVTEYTVPVAPLTPHSISHVENCGLGTKRFPLLIDFMTGTLEVRASDIDPLDSVTTAYITLLLKATQNKIWKSGQIVRYNENTRFKNTISAMINSISLSAEVETFREGEGFQTMIQEEMIRHYEEEIEPVLVQMQRSYKRKGAVFMDQHMVEEMEDKIYKGLTPARRQVNIFNEAKKSMEHKEALREAQKINYINF